MTVSHGFPLPEPASLVKICGIREVEHAVAAVAAGSDLLGFNFAPVRRRIAPDVAAAGIVAARQAGPESMLAVGIFVDTSAAEINRIAAQVGLDLIQLHGHEPPGFAASLALPVIRVHRFTPSTTKGKALADLADHRQAPPGPWLHLVDAYDASALGGTGLRADWDLAAAVAAAHPVGLAGGLNAGNVAAAIRHVRPCLVDVASGVETGGVQDTAKIRDFVQAAKLAFATLAVTPR